MRTSSAVPARATARRTAMTIDVDDTGSTSRETVARAGTHRAGRSPPGSVEMTGRVLVRDELVAHVIAEFERFRSARRLEPAAAVGHLLVVATPAAHPD